MFYELRTTQTTGKRFSHMGFDALEINNSIKEIGKEETWKHVIRQLQHLESTSE
jgi:hypothetical protein